MPIFINVTQLFAKFMKIDTRLAADLSASNANNRSSSENHARIRKLATDPENAIFLGMCIVNFKQLLIVRKRGLCVKLSFFISSVKNLFYNSRYHKNSLVEIPYREKLDWIYV